MSLYYLKNLNLTDFTLSAEIDGTTSDFNNVERASKQVSLKCLEQNKLDDFITVSRFPHFLAN